MQGYILRLLFLKKNQKLNYQLCYLLGKTLYLLRTQVSVKLPPLYRVRHSLKKRISNTCSTCIYFQNKFVRLYVWVYKFEVRSLGTKAIRTPTVNLKLLNECIGTFLRTFNQCYYLLSDAISNITYIS